LSMVSNRTSRLALFRRHLKAVFDADGEGSTAKWLIEEKQRFADQIRRSGIKDKCEHLLNDTADLAKADAPFEVFVIGEGKFGKSTFINALLGYPVAPMDFLPKTWCFNRYIATIAPSSTVKVFVSPDFERRRKDLRQWLKQPIGESRGLLVFEVPHSAADELIQYEEKIFAGAVQHKTHIDDYSFYVSPIMEMEWEVPEDRAILRGIRLVDTQGINQLRQSRDHVHYLKWQFSRADAVIWMMSAERLNSSATREELIEAQRYSKRIILVVNRWDKIENPDRVRELCERLYADYVASIIYFSSVVALVAAYPEAIHSLPGPAKADVAQICKKHGIPNPLHYPEEAAQKLRYISGRDHLTQVLSKELTQKLRYIRNRTLYTTLKQQQHEFRSIAKQTIEEKYHNLETYQQLRQEVMQAYILNERSVHQMYVTLKNSLEAVRQRAQKLTYNDFGGDAHVLQTYLGFDTFNTLLQSKIDEVSRQCTQRYQQVVVTVGKKTAQYRDSEFDPLGRIAFQQTWLPLEDVTIKIEPQIPSTYLWIGRDFIHDILESIPILGDIFSGTRERKRNECASRVSGRAIGKVNEVTQFIQDLRQSLIQQLADVRDNMLKSVDSCFARFGGEHKLRYEIAAVERVLKEPAVRPVFVHLLLHAIKKRRKERYR